MDNEEINKADAENRQKITELTLNEYKEWVHTQVAHKLHNRIVAIIAASGAVLLAVIGFISSIYIENAINTHIDNDLSDDVKSTVGTILIDSSQMLSLLKQEAGKHISPAAKEAIESEKSQLKEVVRQAINEYLGSDDVKKIITDAVGREVKPFIAEIKKQRTEGDSNIKKISSNLEKTTESEVGGSGGISAELLSALVRSVGEDLPSELVLLKESKNALDNGDYEKSRELAKKAKAIDKEKNSGVYDFIIANTYYEEGKYKEAIVAYESAILREPNEPSYYNNMGSAYYALSQETWDEDKRKELLERSLQATRKSLEIENNSPSVIVNTSIVLNQLGRYQESVELLDGWKGDSNPHITYQLSATYALIGEADQSLRFLEKSIQENDAIALQAAADDDFAALRKNEGFRSLLEKSLGEVLFQAVVATWDELPNKEN